MPTAVFCGISPAIGFHDCGARIPIPWRMRASKCLPASLNFDFARLESSSWSYIAEVQGMPSVEVQFFSRTDTLVYALGSLAIRLPLTIIYAPPGSGRAVGFFSF